DLRDEARVGPEPRIRLVEAGLHPPLPRIEVIVDAEPVAVEDAVRLIEARRDLFRIFGLRLEVLEADVVPVADANPAIDARELVAVVVAGAARDEHAERRRVLAERVRIAADEDPV